MINTVLAIIHEGRIEPLQKIAAPEGTRVLVTLLLEDEADFWLDASSASLDEVWDNAEDDRYAELLEA
jgi:predicted DNA-binding antitoxin AbrB/MazE fold protein